MIQLAMDWNLLTFLTWIHRKSLFYVILTCLIFINFELWGNEDVDVTDEERVASETFEHAGLQQRRFVEECLEADSKTREACLGRSADPKFLGLSSETIRAASQAYSLILGAGVGGGLKKAPPKPKPEIKNPEGAPVKKQPSKEDQTEQDFCKYIAVGTETMATFQREMSNQEVSDMSQSADTNQQRSLYQIAKTHGDRAKTSKIQMRGWGATATCYAAMMARPSISLKSVGNWAKLGAAGILTAFFKEEAEAHEKYEKLAKEVADKMPGVGDCNPVTERLCYCAQPETENDPQYCLSDLHKKKLAHGNSRMACLDSNGNIDQSCACIADNSCYDKRLREVFNFPGSTATQVSNAIEPFDSMTKGQLPAGSVRGNVDANNSARNVKDLLTQLDSKIPESAPSVANDLGIPNKVMGAITRHPLIAEASNSSNFNSRRSPIRRRRFNASKGGKVIELKGGEGISNSKDEGYKNPFSNIPGMKKKSRTASRGKVIHLMDKAQQKAQITQQSDRPIFEIISRRYKNSAWQSLQIN